MTYNLQHWGYSVFFSLNLILTVHRDARNLQTQTLPRQQTWKAN